MHRLQSHREARHRKHGRPKPQALSSPKPLRINPKLSVESTPQDPTEPWLATSDSGLRATWHMSATHDIFTRRRGSEPLASSSTPSNSSPRMTQFSEAYFEPRHSILGAFEQDKVPYPIGIQNSASKIEHDNCDCFKTENMLKPRKSVIGRPWINCIERDDPNPEYVVCTNLDQPSDSQRHSGPQITRGRKRASSYLNNDPSAARNRHGGDGGDDHGDDEGQHNDGGGNGTKKLKTGGVERRLACPFFKHDPAKFNRHPCCGPGFATVHRVK